jgi:nucleoside-diphosphate-sugar epimerase
MNNKVVVTGVAGFVGSNLAGALLDRGYEVVGIDDLSQGTLENIPSGVRFHQIDICEEAIQPLFAGADTVFHLAAKNCLPDCAAHPLQTSLVNVSGTVQVLEAARRASVRKFIYADSSAEYEGISELPSRIDCVCPIGTYAVSKRSGALFCESYRRMFGLNVTVLRYFNVYGPAQDWRRVIPPVMSAFILKMLRGEAPVIFGTGQKRRDFIYVDDVNRFQMLAMADPRADGRTFNVGSGTNHSVLQVYELIESILRTGIKPTHGPELPGDTEATLADISDSVAMGWTPEVSLEQGIRRSIDYIRTRVLAASGNAKVVG